MIILTVILAVLPYTSKTQKLLHTHGVRERGEERLHEFKIDLLMLAASEVSLLVGHLVVDKATNSNICQLNSWI